MRAGEDAIGNPRTRGHAKNEDAAKLYRITDDGDLCSMRAARIRAANYGKDRRDRERQFGRGCSEGTHKSAEHRDEDYARHGHLRRRYLRTSSVASRAI